jgi:hypothetical protein
VLSSSSSDRDLRNAARGWQTSSHIARHLNKDGCITLVLQPTRSSAAFCNIFSSLITFGTPILENALGESRGRRGNVQTSDIIYAARFANKAAGATTIRRIAGREQRVTRHSGTRTSSPTPCPSFLRSSGAREQHHQTPASSTPGNSAQPRTPSCDEYHNDCSNATTTAPSARRATFRAAISLGVPALAP